MRLFGWILVVAALAATRPATAHEPSNWLWHSHARDYARNNWWPEPFSLPDQNAAMRPFAVMVNRGWQVQHTVTSHHFQSGSSHLTEAGKLKVHWIINDPHPDRRTVYVEPGLTPRQTAERIEAIKVATRKFTPAGVEPMVFPTSIRWRPWGADRVHAIQTGMMNSIPPPKLPAPRGDGT